MAQLNFSEQIIKTFQDIPSSSSSDPKIQELRKAYNLNQQVLKQANIHQKFKLQNSFWNQDITQIELQTTQLVHDIAYFEKPNVFKQTPKFSTHYQDYLSHKGKINLTLEQQRQALLKYFEDQVATMWLRRRWLIRNRIKQLHIPSVKQLDNQQPFHQLVDYDKFVIKDEQLNSSNWETHGYRLNVQESRLKQIEQVDAEIMSLEQRIGEYDSLCDKLANEKIYESQSHYDKVHVPQLQISANDELIFDKVNQKVMESIPFLKTEHLRMYYDHMQNKHVGSRQCTYVRIYFEAAQYRAQYETVFRRQAPIKPYDYMVPKTLQGLQEQLKLKAQRLGVTQDMTVDSGALFLYAIDKQFKIGIEVQSTEYLQFLPYEVQVETQSAISSSTSLKVTKSSFQMYTIKMLKEMKEEVLMKKQYRLRSAVHWIDDVQILPDQTPNDLQTKLIFDQYEDTAVKSWMNFLLYHDTDKINMKLGKDILMLQESSKSTTPDIYFQFYHRFLKILVLDSRQSLIKILSVLNVFRSCQKNLNIYYMELNNIPHQLTKEKVDKRSGYPLSSQQETYNSGSYNEGIFLTNPTQAQNAQSSRLSSNHTEESQRNDLFLKIESTSYSHEESITYDEGLFKVIDGLGFKVLNETALQDFFALQSSLQHICSFILHYNLKHGFEDVKQEEQNQYLIELNREKVIQEVLAFEAQWLTQKCRIMQVIQPLLNQCGPEQLHNSICLLTRLMSLRPKFELKNNIFQIYEENCDLMQLLAMVCEDLRTHYQESDYKPLIKLMVCVVEQTFPEQDEFTYEQRKLALLDLHQNQVRLLINPDTFDSFIPIDPRYGHLFNDMIIDTKNNFELVVHHIISQAEKGQLESFNCNIFSLLEFTKLRRRSAKTVLRLLWVVEIFQRQVRGMGRLYAKQYQEKIDSSQRFRTSSQRNDPSSPSLNDGSRRKIQVGSSIHITTNQSHIDATIPRDPLDMLSMLLDEGISIGKEINKLENWSQFAADTLKMLDMTIPLNALILLNSYCFNSIQLNNQLFLHVIQSLPKHSYDEDQMGMLMNINLQSVFVDIVSDKIKLSQVVQSNINIKRNSLLKEEVDVSKEHQPHHQILQQVCSLLAQGKQNRSGSVSQALLKTFMHKLQGHTASAVQQFNILIHKECMMSAQCIIAIHQRKCLIDFNLKLPFTKLLFQSKEFPIELNVAMMAQMQQKLKHYENGTDEDTSNGMIDSKGYLCNPFVIPSLMFILKIKKQSQGEQERSTRTQTTAYMDAHKYNPGGEEWIKFQKLKMEQGNTPLSPNKKLTKFRSAGYPYTGQIDVDLQPTLFLVSSAMQVCIQLTSLLISFYSPSCDRVDLIFFHAGLLGQDNNQIDLKEEDNKLLGYYKGNQLRLRRDLVQMVDMVDRIKLNVTRIICNPNILQQNQAVLTYLMKYTNRVYMTQLVTAMASINQFRHDSQQYDDLIRYLKRLLVEVQFRNVGHLERMQNQTAQIARSITKQRSMGDDKIQGSSLMQLLKHVFGGGVKLKGPFNQNTLDPLDYYTQVSPYMLPTQQHTLMTQKLCYNPSSYFNHVTQHIPNCFKSIFMLFPQSKLIYYSTIQDMIRSESEDILRNSFVFEDQDVFAYERSYQKIIKIHYRYLILSEHLLMHKFKTLPFEPIHQLQTQDLVGELISVLKRGVSEHLRKQAVKQSFLLGVPRLSQKLQAAIKIDLDHKSNTKKSSNKDSASTPTTKTEKTENMVQFVILDKLRIENFSSMLSKLSAVMIGCHNIILQEGIEFYQSSTQLLAKCTNQLRLIGQNQNQIIPSQIEDSTRFGLALKLSTFLGNFQRDSLIIQTLNLGEAHVISNKDLYTHISYLNTSITGLYDDGILKQMKEISEEKEEIIKMYNIKGLENEFLHKKIRFYETHIGHIVESLVAQRTNNLIFENDGLKLDIERMQKQQDIQSHILRDEIKVEFKHDIQDQAINQQVLQNRFQDYKKGINLELKGFIDVYKQDGLRKIKDQTVVALKEGSNYTNVNLNLNDDGTQEPKQKKLSAQIEEVDITQDVGERFSSCNQEVIKLFGTLKTLRLFYQMREGTLRSKFETQIQNIKVGNQSNEELLKSIENLSEKVETLKDEVSNNKRVMTVMDNQNQILRRDLQKVKVERMRTMKERGISEAATYQQKLGQEEVDQTYQTLNQVSQVEQSSQIIQDIKMESPHLISRPQTALSTKRSQQQIQTKLKSDQTQSQVSLTRSNPQKTNLLSVKYRIQKR